MRREGNEEKIGYFEENFEDFRFQSLKKTKNIEPSNLRNRDFSKFWEVRRGLSSSTLRRRDLGQKTTINYLKRVTKCKP